MKQIINYSCPVIEFCRFRGIEYHFVGYGFAYCFSRAPDRKWLNEYNKGKNNFSDHFSPALDTTQRLVGEAQSFEYQISRLKKMLFTRPGAMGINDKNDFSQTVIFFFTLRLLQRLVQANHI